VVNGNLHTPPNASIIDLVERVPREERATRKRVGYQTIDGPLLIEIHGLMPSLSPGDVGVCIQSRDTRSLRRGILFHLMDVGSHKLPFERIISVLEVVGLLLW